MEGGLCVCVGHEAWWRGVCVWGGDCEYSSGLQLQQQLDLYLICPGPHAEGFTVSGPLYMLQGCRPTGRMHAQQAAGKHACPVGPREA